MTGHVYVNRGRWVVDCPNPECGWAYDAVGPTGAYRYLHRCTGDNTGPGCNTPFQLVWPEPDMAEEIMWALAMRPATATRNWLPTETVDRLLDENAAHLAGRDLEYLADNGIGVVC